MDVNGIEENCGAGTAGGGGTDTEVDEIQDEAEEEEEDVEGVEEEAEGVLFAVCGVVTEDI